MTEELQPTDLIDTSDNKPIEEEQETQETHKQIGPKRIKDLTNEERSIIINNAKNGIDNEYYKVQMCKNGSSRITKKKPAKESTSDKLIKNHGPGLSTEQLLMEHVIGLETQLATMRQKQKRLKGKYKQLYQDIYIEDEDITNQSSTINNTTAATNNDLNPSIPNTQPQEEPEQVSQSELQQNSISFPTIKRRCWRARIPMYY